MFATSLCYRSLYSSPVCKFEILQAFFPHPFQRSFYDYMTISFRTSLKHIFANMFRPLYSQHPSQSAQV